MDETGVTCRGNGRVLHQGSVLLVVIPPGFRLFASRFIPSRKYSISKRIRSVGYHSSTKLSRFALTFISPRVFDLTNIRRLTVNRVLYFGRRWESLWKSTHATLPKVGDILSTRDDLIISIGSSFLQQTLTSGYPKLLRLFHEFFASIAVHTDTVYTPTFQS